MMSSFGMLLFHMCLEKEPNLHVIGVAADRLDAVP